MDTAHAILNTRWGWGSASLWWFFHHPCPSGALFKLRVHHLPGKMMNISGFSFPVQVERSSNKMSAKKGVSVALLWVVCGRLLHRCSLVSHFPRNCTKIWWDFHLWWTPVNNLCHGWRMLILSAELSMPIVFISFVTQGSSEGYYFFLKMLLWLYRHWAGKIFLYIQPHADS